MKRILFSTTALVIASSIALHNYTKESSDILTLSSLEAEADGISHHYEVKDKHGEVIFEGDCVDSKNSTCIMTYGSSGTYVMHDQANKN